ncbi:MAG: hypothetical protein ACT4OO_03475 [Nitrospiraceae bacterium]
MRTITSVLVAAVLLISSAGCSYIFYPRAKEYREQAKGATGVETLLNLTTMLDASTKAARSPQNYQAAMDDLHNQLHALHDSFCAVTEQQAKTPTYAKAVTLKEEMWKIFWPLWKKRDDQALRDVHLDLFGKRNQELRETLETLKS